MSIPVGSNSPVGNVIKTAISNAVVPLAAVATMPILARSLGVDGRGELAAATSLLVLLTAVGTLGLPDAVTYYVARRPLLSRRITTTASWILLLTGAILTLAVCAFFLASIDKASQLAVLICASSAAVGPGLVIAAWRGLASGLHRWEIVAKEKYLTTALRLVLIGGLGVAGELTVPRAVAIAALVPVIGGLVAYLPMLRCLNATTRNLATGSLRRARHLATYGQKVWAGSVTGILLSRLDQVVMIPLSGPFQLGIYAAAVNVADVGLLLNNAVRDIMFSSQAAKFDTRKLCSAARISFALSTVVAVVLSTTSHLWFPILFGHEFADGAKVAVILLFAGAIGVPGSVAGAGLASMGCPGLRSASITVAAIVNVGAMLALVPPFGALGAAIAVVIGSVIASNANIFFVVRRHKNIRFVNFYSFNVADGRAVLAVLSSQVEKRENARQD